MKKREDCFHDKNYEDIKKKLEAANKNIKYCYIQGPTGPKGSVGPTGPRGEKGPSSIKIGEVTSVPYDENAYVVNVGTLEDVILNFKIPRGAPGEMGAMGPKGETGPRGLPGEIGISQAITIDGTETVESGEEAFVQDDFDRNIHHLTFYLPKGETGPAGPQGPIGPAGPAGSSAALSYAMRFLSFIQDLVLTANTETVIPLSQTGPAFNMDYNSANAIGVRDSGFYLATYYLHATADKNVTLTMSIKADGVNVPSGRIEVQMTSGVACNVSHSIIVALKADETVNLVAETPTETKLSFGNNVNSSLCLIKLH